MSGGGYTSLNSAPDAHEPVAKPSKLREVMAGLALFVSIGGFVVQTEVLGYVAMLGYHKPMMVMYVTHSCMILLLPMQIFFVWVVKAIQRHDGFFTFYKRHTSQLKSIARLVTENNGHPASSTFKYISISAALLAVALNFAGASWYIAVNMTTTADLTAIFNCSTFFAYIFSVWVLKERLSLAKSVSVVLSILGVVVIAYLGSSKGATAQEATSWRRRMIGNIIIALGTILYGVYEVLYKKIACPPQRVSARKQAAFANLIGAAVGVGTIVLMWPVLIVLHFTGLETIEAPSAEIFRLLVASIAGNVLFSGAFLVLMSLTSPVLGSVSSLLATCTVPIVNFAIWRQKINLAEIVGGIMIVLAFGLMTWASSDDFVEEDNDSDTEPSR